MLTAFLHGFILSIGLIIPLGVQNFFVFSQGAIRRHRLSVAPIVLTASLCDTALILLAVSGVSLIILSFAWMKTALLGIGILFLLYMGVLSWKAKANTPKGQARQSDKLGPLILYTMMISILNPHAILDTVGVIGTSSLSYQGGEKITFTLACIAVSWFWFCLLALLGRLIGSKDPSGKFEMFLNKLSAFVMWGAAVYLATQLNLY